jgi:hypothetical protein
MQMSMSRGKFPSQIFSLYLSLDNSTESRLSSTGFGSDKVQMQKIGNSKILVVKKKGAAAPQSSVNSPPPNMG